MRVMVVEDEEDILLEIRSLLEEYDMVEVVGALTDSREALAVAPAMRPDVAFLDIQMPGISGIELAAKLLDQLPLLQVVFVTAFDNYDVRAFEINAIDYLLKPVHPQRLAATVQRLMGRETALVGDQGLRIEAFGGFEVYLNKDRVKWERSRSREIFACLLFATGQKMHKLKLCSFLWPQLDERQALINLQTTMYSLRRKLADPLSENLRIEYSENSYILHMISFSFDYQDFLHLYRHWQDGHNPAIAEEALALGRAGLLEGEGWTWAQPFQAGCELKYLEMATWLAEKSYAEGRYYEVVQRVIEMAEQYEPWSSAQVVFVRAVCALYSQPEASAKLNDFHQQLTQRFGVGLAPEAVSLIPLDGGE